MAKPIADRIPGVRIVAETRFADSEGQPGVTVSCFANDRSRVGADASEATYTIERRDLRLQYRVFSLQRRYQTIPIFGLLSEEEKERFVRSGRHWRKSVETPQPQVMRELRIRTTCEKTEEKKTIFGCTARRWIITQRSERDPIHGENWTETVTESWYLDSDELRQSYPGFSERLIHRSEVIARSGDERVVRERVGEYPRGLCAYSESKTHSYAKFPNGEVREQTSLYISEITSIVAELFEASFFESPAGFRAMPVYPGRIALARHDLVRKLRGLRWHVFRHA
jgi:hypothetical protein